MRHRDIDPLPPEQYSADDLFEQTLCGIEIKFFA